MKKAFIFDFDDTLATTAAQVIVRDSMNVAYRSLTPAQFNAYKLGNGESFDFSEFRDEDFVHNADPTLLIHLAREVYDEGHAVYVLTARDASISDAIHTWLKTHGIDAIEIHCVGGTTETIPWNKKRVLLDMVKKYDKIYFYDDSEENINIFQHDKLRSYLV